MAAAAADRHAEQRCAQRAGDVVELFVAAALAFLLSLLRWHVAGDNPVAAIRSTAARASSVVLTLASVSRSPASCRRTNSSYGMSAFNARMTKSR